MLIAAVSVLTASTATALDLRSQLPSPIQSDFPMPTNASQLPFTCYNADHHFKHQHWWISASSKTGCMSLELREEAIYQLNKISNLQPKGFKTGDTLACSAEEGKCSWVHNPTQAVTGAEPKSTAA